MQFPVPQFTEAEDKIIGTLTVRQFIIVFIAGMVVVLSYTSTKNVLVAGFFFLIFGLPALFAAFGPFNGRKMYNCLPFIIKFVFLPKIYIFHKEGAGVTAESNVQTVEMPKEKQPDVEAPEARLKKLNYLLESKAREEAELLKVRNNR